MKDGSLHVWRLPPMPSPYLLRAARDILSETEKRQCERFLRAEDRARCAAARTALRIVLSRYLSLPPNALPIAAGESGKPYLDVGGDIQFNLAHAGHCLQIAVSRGASVGIDIERIRDVAGMESIVDDFFDESERTCVRSRRGKARRKAFFRLWTRREAAAKALGLDLFDAFARCELPAFHGSHAWFRLALPPAGAPAGRETAWWIRDFLPAPGYAGALCAQRVDPRPTFYHLRSW